MKKKITSLFCCLITACTLTATAQTISVVATGLTNPIGICRDTKGGLLVAQSGTGANDGKIVRVDSAGVVTTIVYGLPSATDTAAHETSGPWRPYLVGDSMLNVIVGSGPDSSAGSIMQFNLNGVQPGTDSLTITDAVRIIRVQAWALSNGFTDSDVFSAVWDSVGNIYVADAGANAVFRLDTAGNISVVDTFPGIPNTWTPAPPMIDYVPTKLISDMHGGFYLCNLTGFPFLPGISQVITIDTGGTTSTYATGLTQAVDMEIDSSGNLYVLQFGLYDSTFTPVMNSASILRISSLGIIDTLATGFGPSAGMTRDSSDGFYVTEIFTGRVLHISNTTTSIKEIRQNQLSVSAYPNPFGDNISVDVNLPQATPLSFSISDATGKRIYYKVDNMKSAGQYHLSIDSHEIDFTSLSKGVYYLTIIAGESSRTISLLKK